jgi:hypothetical protein
MVVLRLLLLCTLGGGGSALPPRSPPAATCPCSDAALCKPLSPTPKPKDEVLAFPASHNDTVEKLYDWSKITTIAPFQPLGPQARYHQLYCDAHKHGVKVLDAGSGTWNGSRQLLEFYKWCLTNSSQAYNQAAILAWAESTATGIAATGFDGAMLDFEGDYTKLWPTLRAQVTVGVCALKSALTRALPGAVLYWSVDTGNYFDYSEMIDQQCVDMFLVMDYCLCTPDSRSNAPLTRVNRTSRHFARAILCTTYIHVLDKS